MPRDLYKIGDKVYSPYCGIGYVVCQSHFIDYTPGANTPGISVPVYLLYIDDKTGPAYLSYGIATKLKQAATPESIDLIQTNILDMIKIEDGQYAPHEPKLHPGDIIRSQIYGNGIILSTGCFHPCNQNHTYYHVYYIRPQQFALEALGRFRLQKTATDTTRQQAIRIINEKILRPVFSV